MKSVKKKYLSKTLVYKNKKFYTYDSQYECLPLLSDLNLHKLENCLKKRFNFKCSIVCPHIYFKYTGPCLKGVLTRQMKIWKKSFHEVLDKKNHVCKKIIIIATGYWNKLKKKYYKNKRRQKKNK